MSESMMTNQDIEEFCNRFSLPLIGVFSKDDLPFKSNRRDGFYVVNLQDEYDAFGKLNSGTHWVCFIVDGKETVYHDSYGIAPPRQVIEFLEDLKPFPYLSIQVQSVRSGFCGLYCMFFALYMYSRDRNVNMLNRLYAFSRLWARDTSKNLSKLKNYMFNFKNND